VHFDCIVTPQAGHRYIFFHPLHLSSALQLHCYLRRDVLPVRLVVLHLSSALQLHCYRLSQGLALELGVASFRCTSTALLPLALLAVTSISLLHLSNALQLHCYVGRKCFEFFDCVASTRCT